MNELLIELKERLNQISITGLKSVSEDFRLKKLYEKLQIISTKAPVFSKISELTYKLINKNDEKTYIVYSELVNLINAVLYTQGNSSTDEKEIPMNLIEHNENNTFLRYSQMQSIRNILLGGTTSIWSGLKKAYEEKSLLDYRLLNDFMKQIGNKYVYDDGFSIISILSGYGENIIPLLLEKFDTAENSAKSNIIKIISNVEKEKYNDYYKKWIDEEDDDNVVLNAIKALLHDKNNEEFLLSLKLKKKKLQQARIFALAYMPSKQSHEEVKKYCFKDIELLTEIFKQTPFISEEELIILIKECINDLKQSTIKITDNKNKKIDKQIKLNLLYALISATYKYNSENITNVLIEVIESEIESEITKDEIETKIYTQNAVKSLLEHGDKKSLEYLLTIENKFDNYYAMMSFLAALKLCTKEQIFDKYSPICLKKDSYIKLSIFNVLCQIINGSTNIYLYNEYINLEDYKNIDLDKRWFDYVLKNNLISSLPDLANILKHEIPIDYMKDCYLEYLKKIDHSKLIKDNKENRKVNSNIENVILGLFKIDAKTEAMDNIVCFLPAYYTASASFFNSNFEGYLYRKGFSDYLNTEDIEILKNNIQKRSLENGK